MNISATRKNLCFYSTIVYDRKTETSHFYLHPPVFRCTGEAYVVSPAGGDATGLFTTF